MSNRCISYIEAIERESKQRERTARSQELLAAAVAEATDAGVSVTLTKNEHGEVEKFFLSDERLTVLLIVADNVVYRRDARTPKYTPIREFPETDVHAFVLSFAAGEFHKH